MKEVVLILNCGLFVLILIDLTLLYNKSAINSKKCLLFSLLWSIYLWVNSNLHSILG
jgi:hypothetical protein